MMKKTQAVSSQRQIPIAENPSRPSKLEQAKHGLYPEARLVPQTARPSSQFKVSVEITKTPTAPHSLLQSRHIGLSA